MHHKDMTTFIIFVVAVLAVGLLSLRYGVDTRDGSRQI